MPYFISAFRMQKVLMKPAVPDAMVEISPLNSISLPPLTPTVYLASILFRARAKDTEEPTAIVYPVARSLVV